MEKLKIALAGAKKDDVEALLMDMFNKRTSAAIE